MRGEVCVLIQFVCGISPRTLEIGGGGPVADVVVGVGGGVRADGGRDDFAANVVGESIFVAGHGAADRVVGVGKGER